MSVVRKGVSGDDACSPASLQTPFLFLTNTLRSRVEHNVRLQRNVPEEQVDHRDGDGVHDNVGDPSPLLIVRRLALVHRAASAELRLTHHTRHYHEVQHDPQPDQAQEDAPAPLDRGGERRDVRTVQHALRLSGQRQTHLAHLVVDQTLRDDHANGGPEVLAQTLVGGVVEEVIGLADGGQRQQAPDDEADHDERVLR